MHRHEAGVLADVLMPSGILDIQGSGSLREYVSSIAEWLELTFGMAMLNSAEVHKRQKLYDGEGSCHWANGVGMLAWLDNPTKSRTSGHAGAGFWS